MPDTPGRRTGPELPPQTVHGTAQRNVLSVAGRNLSRDVAELGPQSARYAQGAYLAQTVRGASQARDFLGPWRGGASRSHGPTRSATIGPPAEVPSGSASCVPTVQPADAGRDRRRSSPLPASSTPCPPGPTTTRPSSSGSGSTSFCGTGPPSPGRRTCRSPGASSAASTSGRTSSSSAAAGRGRPGLLQRLPPPRDRRGGARLREGRPLPVRVPRLDLRPRRPARPGQAHRGSRGLLARRLRPGAHPLRDVGSSCSCASPTRRRRRRSRPTWATGSRTMPGFGRDLSSLRRAARLEYDVAANWKIVAENYSEYVTAPPVHPLLNKLTPYDLGEDFAAEGALEGRLDGLRQRVRDHVGGRPSPRPAAPVGARRDGGAPDLLLPALANLIVNVHPDYVLVHHTSPESADRTRVTCDLYVDGDTVATADVAGAVSSGTSRTARTTTWSSSTGRHAFAELDSRPILERRRRSTPST